MTLSLDKFKKLLGIIDAAQETALQFILDDVTETILNYCNLNELPQGLENTAYRMALIFTVRKVSAQARHRQAK